MYTMSTYTPHTPLSFHVPNDPGVIVIDTPDGKVNVIPPPFIESKDRPNWTALDRSSEAAFAATGGADVKHRNASVAVGVGALILAKLGLNVDTATSLAIGVGSGGAAWYYLNNKGSHVETMYW